jgi:hypothetical protein
MGKNFGKITHLRHDWTILPILVGKRITDLNEKNSSRKWVKFIKFFICVDSKQSLEIIKYGHDGALSVKNFVLMMV